MRNQYITLGPSVDLVSVSLEGKDCACPASLEHFLAGDLEIVMVRGVAIVQWRDIGV